MADLFGEKCFKLCDDFVSNEAVHIDKKLINRSTKQRSILVEGYIGGNFNFEVRRQITYRHCDFSNYRVVLQRLSRADMSWTREFEMASMDAITVNPSNLKGNLMFFIIDEFVKDEYGVVASHLIFFVSIEGLQLRNQGLCSCRELRQDSLVSLYPSLKRSCPRVGSRGKLHLVNREGDFTRIGFSNNLSKPPNQIIKDISQFGQRHPNWNTQSVRDFASHNESITNYLGISMNFLLGDYGVRFAVEKNIGFQFKVIDELFRRSQSISDFWYVISGLHISYSKHEKEIRAMPPLYHMRLFGGII